MHYLDYAATTPVPAEVAKTMYDVLTEGWGNPSSQYAIGRDARARVASDRTIIARALGCKSEELVFTSCGTESDNWAISAALWQNRRVGKHIVTTAVEHNAILEPCKWLAQQGYEITYLAPDKNGNISVSQVADALRPDTVLISMMLVNNETGCVFPVAETAKLLKERASAALLHTDAVQGFLKVPCAPEDLGVDFLSLSAHKVGGPKGIGALYIGPRVKNPRPLLPGGGQENGRRSGTEATAQIAGFARAVALRQEDLAEKLSHMEEIKAYCLEKLLSIPGVVRFGQGTAPHVLSVSLVGYPSANIVNDLSAQGIYISAGSACHQGKASHVVSAMHADKKVAAGVIRISFAPETERSDIDALYEALLHHQKNRFPML